MKFANGGSCTNIESVNNAEQPLLLSTIIEIIHIPESSTRKSKSIFGMPLILVITPLGDVTSQIILEMNCPFIPATAGISESYSKVTISPIHASSPIGFMK